MSAALAQSRVRSPAIAADPTAGGTARSAATPPPGGPLPSGISRPIVSLPDVRLAYLYEWVDAEGNRHFGAWVAIPLSPARWILPDGSTASLDGHAASPDPRPSASSAAPRQAATTATSATPHKDATR